MIPPEGLSERELVEKAQAGDEQALAALFERHVAELRGRVRRRLQGLVRRRVAESDVLQEAFLTAFLRLSDFDDRGPGSFGRWISRIVENKVRDALRHHLGTRKRRGERETATAPEATVLYAGHSPSSQAALSEASQRLRDAMKGLSELDRNILLLVHEQALRFREVGERLGLTADAARMRYTRALSRLSKRLEPGTD